MTGLLPCPPSQTCSPQGPCLVLGLKPKGAEKEGCRWGLSGGAVKKPTLPAPN